MHGYYRDPAATAAALRDGWLHTGDRGRQDGDGYFYITGRVKDLIITGGENVSPVEVEEVLRAHPDVDDVAVIGTPHPKWGEQVTAVVVAAPGRPSTPTRVAEFAGQRLAGFKKPRRVEFVAALPRNAAKKVMTGVLRERFGQGSVRTDLHRGGAETRSERIDLTWLRVSVRVKRFFCRLQSGFADVMAISTSSTTSPTASRRSRSTGPEQLNALLPEMNDRLPRARRPRRGATTRCASIVLTGAGRAFSAGADLKRMGAPGAPRAQRAGRARSAPCTAPRWSSACCGARSRCSPRSTASPPAWPARSSSPATSPSPPTSARFVFSFVKVGFIPDSGCTYLLPRRVGLANAQRLCLTGEPVAAAEALRLGLVSEVVPAAESRRARRAPSPRRSPATRRTRCGMTRGLLERGAASDFRQAIEAEALAQGILGETADHQEAVRAFVEKRAAGVHRQVMETLGAFLDAVRRATRPSARRSPTRRATASPRA